MKIGDILVDFNNRKWIIFDIVQNWYCVMDFETHSTNDAFSKEMIKECCKKPENVEVLYLKKREKVMKHFGFIS